MILVSQIDDSILITLSSKIYDFIVASYDLIFC